MKTEKALKTISEVSVIISVPSHVIRFWEEKFPKLKPVKYNGRRYYSQKDIKLLKKIKDLLYNQEYSIKGALIYLKSPISKIELPSLEGTMEKLVTARDKLIALLH